MQCPSCGNPKAEAVINNYWNCPNPRCENFTEAEEPTLPGIQPGFINPNCRHATAYTMDLSHIALNTTGTFCQDCGTLLHYTTRQP